MWEIVAIWDWRISWYDYGRHSDDIEIAETCAVVAAAENLCWNLLVSQKIQLLLEAWSEVWLILDAIEEEALDSGYMTKKALDVLRNSIWLELKRRDLTYQ